MVPEMERELQQKEAMIAELTREKESLTARESKAAAQDEAAGLR